MSNRLNIAKTVGLIGLATLLAGCGVYSFTPGKATISTIALEPFENQTPQYSLADQMTETVIDAFISDGSLKVVESDVAEAILVGTLTSYERLVHEFDQSDQVAQYKVQIGFDVALTNPEDQSEIWKIQLTLDGIYDADGETEEDGQRLVGEQLVDAVINKTTKSW